MFAVYLMPGGTGGEYQEEYKAPPICLELNEILLSGGSVIETTAWRLSSSVEAFAG